MKCRLENYIDKNLQLQLLNPTKYYLNHIDDEEIMLELARDDPYLFQHVIRQDYIQKISSHERLYQCPECQSNIVQDEWGEQYCPNCGVVTRSHSRYVAGFKHELSYGLKI